MRKFSFLPTEQRSVSPVIATVLLIAITIVIVGIVAAFMGRIRLPAPPIHARLSFETITVEGSDETVLVIKHAGGDSIPKAFEGSGSSLQWKDLDARLNGAPVEMGKPAIYNGELNWSGVKDFGVGDVLKIPLDILLRPEDTISVVYNAAAQTLSALKGREIKVNRTVDTRTGLVGKWLFDEGSGTTAGDASGFGNNGTIYSWGDDFDDGNDDGWTRVAGTWAVEGGEYSQSDTALSRAISVAGDVEWTDYTVEAKVKLIGGAGEEAILIFRSGANTDNRYEFILRSRTENDVLLHTPQDGIIMDVNLGFSPALDTWYTMKVVTSGTSIKCYLDGNLYIDTTHTRYSKGRVGFATWQTHAHFDDIRMPGTPTWLNWIDGKVGKALSFDGADDYVRKTSPSGFDFATTNEITAAAWIKLTPSDHDF